MFERILVPLDGSKLAEAALPYAANLAAALGSELHLIHVSDAGHDQYEHMHQLYLQQKVESVLSGAALYPSRRQGKPVTVKSATLTGQPAEQILDYAEREDISVINIATHGRSGISRWVLGSVADKVIRATKRPVALFRAERPAGPSAGQPSSIKYLVPLDGAKESEAIIPYVQELALKVGGEVIFLAVVTRATRPITTPGAPFMGGSMEAASAFTEDEMRKYEKQAETYMNKICSGLEKKGVKASCVVRFGAAVDEILRFADEIDPHIICLVSTEIRSVLGRASIGSTTEKIIQLGKRPLLLIRG